MVFRTKNSVYIADTEKKTITGGVFGSASFPYLSLSAMVGTQAVIVLENGQIVRTSTIVGYN